MLDTLPRLKEITFPQVRRGELTTLQLNVGYRCNQQCLHCHVNAGPNRVEDLNAESADAVIRFLERFKVDTLDITGGAPELNSQFRRLVREARERGLHVIDRCNLSVLLEDGQENLPEFLATQDVEVVASMPCYLEENVDAQRGKGVFNASIEGLLKLNEVGFGMPDSALALNLVYNPQGPQLPPSQCALEPDYKRVLLDKYGIRFNNLLTLVNMPIARFGSMLLSKGEFDDYMGLLQTSHQEANLENVMCRNLISVDWQGYVYDCDFNQMLDLPLGGKKTHLDEVKGERLSDQTIAVAGHCFGCTAGQGSSCGGALNQ